MTVKFKTSCIEVLSTNEYSILLKLFKIFNPNLLSTYDQNSVFGHTTRLCSTTGEDPTANDIKTFLLKIFRKDLTQDVCDPKSINSNIKIPYMQDQI